MKKEIWEKYSVVFFKSIFQKREAFGAPCRIEIFLSALHINNTSLEDVFII